MARRKLGARSSTLRSRRSRARQLPILNVQLSQHRKRQQIIRIIVQESFEYRSSLALAALPSCEGGFLELPNGEAGLDSRKLGLFRVGVLAKPPHGRGGQFERARLRPPSQQDLRPVECRLGIPLEQLPAFRKQLLETQLTVPNLRAPLR